MDESRNFGGRLADGRVLVVFDGSCGFCDRSVRWVLRHDTRDRLRFVAFQSEKAAALLKRHGVAAPEPDGGSVLAVRSFGGAAESVLMRSDAVVTLLKELPAPWPWVGGALRLVPRGLRDWGYGLVARWRHRISEGMESCPAPTAEERKRFL